MGGVILWVFVLSFSNTHLNARYKVAGVCVFPVSLRRVRCQ